ncbi:sigma-70 family RNA polymerase sigma factor [Halothermothrix orenii]|uniref:RNA polymerase, sigma 28 subunit, FliA/WhiG family n=1 Tax=Halothermothrix orenii (strain H 168 / OCM 544 / DSM 9562) TaxID=373903 RepID=B8CZ00_HALOH|nr:sigma-70 family RNA polymerase sigma factor [Halothermothrix orenii]ACL70519.1 RNA polymerase, sigma 28 subunit, FliA/WhiG family [Halothermothrix orenii H 168]
MINDYLKQLGKIKILEAEEEKELWIKYKDYNDTEARQRLITSYQPLVFKIVRQYARDNEVVMDLIQEGTLGLIDAIDSYDHKRGKSFSSYALYYIRGRVINYLKKAPACSIPAELRAAGSEFLEQLVTEGDDLEDRVEKNLVMDRIKKAVGSLPSREGYIIREIYLKDKKPKKVAGEMGISLSYLHRLKKKAVRRLRGKLSWSVYRGLL